MGPLVAVLVLRSAAPASEPNPLDGIHKSLAATVRLAIEQSFGSFRQLGLDNRFLAALLVVGYLVLLVVRLRRGWASAAHQIAWTAALATWWLGLAWTRWILLDGVLTHGRTFRYDFVGAVFLVLGALPSGRASLPEQWAAPARRLAPAGALVAMVVAVALFWGQTRETMQVWRNGAKAAKVQSASLGLPRGTISDSTNLGTLFGLITVGQARQVVANFGPPPHYGDVPWLLEQSTELQVVNLKAKAPQWCRGVPATLPPLSFNTVFVAEKPTVVQVKRFGSGWVTVAEVPPHQATRLVLSGRPQAEPWKVRVLGACRLSR